LGICIFFIESITFSNIKFITISNLDLTQAKVHELLLHKRNQLMVLDDVWKRNQELEFGVSDDDWYELKVVLRFQSCFLF